MSSFAGFQFWQHLVGHLHEITVFFSVYNTKRVHIRVLAQIFQLGLLVVGVNGNINRTDFGACI